MRPFSRILLSAGLLAGLPALARADDTKPAPAPQSPPPASAPSAPAAAAAAPAQDPRDAIIEALRKTVEDLKRRVEELEKQKANPPTTPPATPPATPPDTPPPTPVPPPPTGPVGGPAGTGGATFLPNISAIGNIQFRGGDSARTGNSGRFNFDEFEIALQDAVTPSMRYDVFLAAAKEEEWKLGLEEGFLSLQRLGHGFTARAGRIRTPFGKVNPLHAHLRRYIDQPAVSTAFLGPEGLVSDGAVVEYLLPTGKKLFARAELGRWETTSEVEDMLGFNGGGNGAWSGRFYVGKALGETKELELGFSRYMGRGKIATGAGDNRDLAVNGVDLTYRSYPGSYKRFILQGELMSHDTGGFAGSRTRIGAYLMAAYRWSQFWEAGIRGDYTEYPFPLPGNEKALHLFLTKYITEQTSVRLQLTHGSAPGFSDYNQVLFQILFGSGPHSHNLQ